MKRFAPVPVVLAALAAGCATGDRDARAKKEIDTLRAENAELKQELEKRRAENAELGREIVARATGGAAANAKAIEELRRELRAARDEVAGARRPEVDPLLVDDEIEERLCHKVEEIKEAAWGSPPSGCVRILAAVIERYPNTRAALKAQGILAGWEVAGVEVTDANAAEIDEKVRARLRARSRLWREVQGAMRAAEQGEAEEAVRALREIAEKHPGEPGRHALEVLENWGVAGLDPAEVDFAELGPRIRRQATAQRETETAFRSLHRGQLDVAAKAFKRVIKRYPDLRQAERAREGLAQAEAALREREEERGEERHRARGRRDEEREAGEHRARERRDDRREADEPGDRDEKEPDGEDRAGDKPEKRGAVPLF